MLMVLYIGDSSCWSSSKMDPMLGAVRGPGFSKTARSHVGHREACRHRLHLRALPILARRHADDLSKSAAEGAQAREADVEADVSDGALGLGQLEHRPLNATALKIAMRSLAKRRPKSPYEVRLRNARDRRQVRSVQRLSICAVDGVAGAKHAAVELFDRPAHQLNPTRRTRSGRPRVSPPAPRQSLHLA